jgi:hypothetical protein
MVKSNETAASTTLFCATEEAAVKHGGDSFDQCTPASQSRLARHPLTTNEGGQAEMLRAHAESGAAAGHPPATSVMGTQSVEQLKR